ncbi:MAG: EVE domain-containing protein [Chloroflexota bacterium]|nr:EVE domain-containing protein [Chloroflexota bacterium]
MTRYWIIVASKAHVLKGVEGGGAVLCQAFTALATLPDDEVFSVKMSEDFVPFRRRARFHPCQHVPIKPLLPALSFIHDKQHWGAPFRFGVLEIPTADYELIAAKMLITS